MGWQALSRLSLHDFDDPAFYRIEDEGLIAAVNTALTLGMPLLLTGAPGVGKTQLAYRIAYELQCQTIFFPVKSTSEAHQLFYEVDQLRRLHAAQANPDDPPDIRGFMRLQGLGLAILRTMSIEELERWKLVAHAWPESEKQKAGYGQRQPSVVLIDEIDKAPTDFPNDLLEEIRRGWFRIPEMEGANEFSIFADPENPKDEENRFRPIVVITSNSEKALPDAFLRRCVYYNIDPPNSTALETIVKARLEDKFKLPEKLQTQALAFYQHVIQSERANLSKKPSTAELLAWLLAIYSEKLTDADIAEEKPSDRWVRLAKACLFKQTEDQQIVMSLIENWKTSQP
jgi:MoxR-like ATPase